MLAVGLVFGQTVRHQFLGYDDHAYVYENPHVTAGLTFSGLWWALTDSPLREWCPLAVVSHMLDCEIYGVNPAGHYLTNLLLHAASSVLLFLVLLRMTGDLWPSAWVAAVFAIHPLHVESVAWLAERRDMLSGLFFMLTLGAYVLYAERPSLARYLTVAGCLALGLMAKPMLVTVPFLLLLLDYWPLGRFSREAGGDPRAESGWWFSRLPVVWRLVVEKIPLMVLAGVNCAITVAFHLAATSDIDVSRVPLAARLSNGLVAYAAYLGQSICPVGLSPFYPLRVHQTIGSVVGALVLLVAITAVAAYFWRRKPYLLVGWLWFLGMLVPVSGFVQIAAHARADRYTYLSGIGLSVALAWSVWSVYRSRQAVHVAAWRRWMLAAVSGGTVLALAAVAWRQTSYWRDAETLWTRALACSEQNALPHYVLAYPYTRQGRIAEAIDHLHQALATDSVDRILIAKCHGLLGDCLASQGKTDEAFAHYEESVRVAPAAAMFHDRLAFALAYRQQLDRAIPEWREAIRLNPAFSQARLGLAEALLIKGDREGAVAQCRAVLGQEPDSAAAIAVLGAALAGQGEARRSTPPAPAGAEARSAQLPNPPRAGIGSQPARAVTAGIGPSRRGDQSPTRQC